MLRKWMVFALSAAVLRLNRRPGFSIADDESPLEKVMEKVNKQSNAIKKGTRNLVQFKKSAEGRRPRAPRSW